MKKRNLSIPDISRATDLSDSTLRSILSRKTKNISLEVAFKLSEGLNVSLEELNGNEEIPQGNSFHESFKNENEFMISKEEENHIEDLRKLNDLGKRKVITYTKDLAEVSKYQTNNNNIETVAAHNDYVKNNKDELKKIKEDIDDMKNW